MKLLFENIKLALQKRRKSAEKKNTIASWQAKGYRNDPMVSFVLQSHNKSLQICHILPKLRQYENAEIIVIDDGSEKKHTDLLVTTLTGADEFLLRANDLFEVVTYDRALRLANGRYVALMQDDDDMEGTEWVTRALELFAKHPKMAILGGWAGCKSFTMNEAEKTAYASEYFDTPKPGEFVFAAGVNRAPMWINRDLYMQSLHHIDFAFAPYQYDDFELCVRAWLSGLQVGLYNANFKSLSPGGMRLYNSALTKELTQRNRGILYERLKGRIDELQQAMSRAQTEQM